VKVLRSPWLTQGPAIAEFEQAVAGKVGCPHAVAVCNATAALHLSCLALGLGKGERLWTSPISFVASANCGLYCGAEVDFVDIDPHTYNLSPIALEEKLKRAARRNRLPKIVVAVHLAGQSCAMKRIFELSQEFGFRVIEDAAHAIGGSYRDQPIGTCKYSDATVFSFHPVKIITTGEGGMITVKQRRIADKLRLLRSHGITRDPVRLSVHQPESWYYEQQELGFNYRLTDLQAALGYSQLGRIEQFLAKRRRIARRYNEALHDLDLVLPFQDPQTQSAWHLYLIRLPERGKTSRRNRVIKELHRREIMANVHYIPIHTQPFYQNLGFRARDFPEAEQYFREVISLPMFYTLSRSEQQFIVQSLREILA
jgi:UDP-4-amino-4,6-dideoxy-N-acetyl-beta-L-altrosamine transaminase